MSVHLDFLVMLATFAVIFPAELPDKSMFASVVLATRYKPLPVFIGLASAFLLHGIIAVSAGSVITLLPHRLVAAIVTVFFLIGAGVLLFSKDSDEEARGDKEAADADADGHSNLKVVATSFGVVFVSEWGDLTQIATINLTARYDNAVSVLIGAVVALWLVCGLGVLLGQTLIKRVPMALVRRIAGIVLLILAVWSLVDFVRG